jgi:hypothetical protein
MAQDRDLDVPGVSPGPNPTRPSSPLTITNPSVRTTTSVIFPDRIWPAHSPNRGLHPSRDGGGPDEPGRIRLHRTRKIGP